MSGKSNSRWIMAEFLATLAEAGLGAGDAFTSAAVDVWLARFPKQRRQHLIARMKRTGLLIAAQQNRPGRYTLTEAGGQAVAAARAGERPACGARPARQKPEGLGCRLWALLRMRGMLDSGTAVNTLADAGDDAQRLRDHVSCYLRRWAQMGVVQVSAKRVGGSGTSNGFKRYVLVQDSPEPPNVSVRERKGRGA